MARFVIDPKRLNYSVEQKGKEYNLRLLQRAQVILSTLLGLLPSNYTSTVAGPNYTLHLKAVATELARIELALEDVSLDISFESTRPEYLYSIVGYLAFLNNRIPTTDFDDKEFRVFLINLIRTYFKGSVPQSMRDAAALFVKSDFNVLENFLLVRQGAADLDISDQFGFQFDILSGGSFPDNLFDLESSLRIVLDLVRPSHTLFQLRTIFTDFYVGEDDETPAVTDAMRWHLSSYYYDDFRKYWEGTQDRDRLGIGSNMSVVGESHSADF